MSDSMSGAGEWSGDELEDFLAAPPADSPAIAAAYAQIERLGGIHAAEGARKMYAQVTDPAVLLWRLREDIKDWERQRESETVAHERIWTYGALRKEWVYIGAIGRFLRRDRPDVSDATSIKNLPPLTIWKKEHFNDFFAYCTRDKHGIRPVSHYLLHEKGARAMPRVERTVYQPNERELVQDRRDALAYNLWKPSTVVPAEGDTKLWNEHLEYLFPDPIDRKHVLNWGAWFLQNLDKKPKHALLIAGETQGTGKSYIFEVFARLVGMHNVSPLGSPELSSSFNKWAMHSKLLVIEELRALDRREIANKLHPLITQEHITINDKGASTYDTENCFGIGAMTNDEAAVKLDASDRRYLVVRTLATPKPNAYYHTLYASLRDPAFLAAVAYELMHRDLQGYDARAKAPLTEAKEDMIAAGADAWAKWMRDHAEDKAELTYNALDPDEIKEAMPPELRRLGVDDEIRKALKEKPWKAERVNSQIRNAAGEKVRVWLRASARRGLSDINTPQRIYRLERRKVRAAAAAAEKADFAPGVPNADDILS